MKIIEIRIEGGYAHKCVRPTIELESGEQVMLGFSDVSKIDATFKAQALEHGGAVPDLTELKSLVGLLETITDNVIVKDGMVLVQNKDKPKVIDKTITPLCNPLEVAPDCACIDEICTIVHTPEAKQACIDAQPPKQKTVKVTKPFSRIEMVEGVPTLKTGEEEVDEGVFEEIPVVDEAGNPAMQLVSEAVEAVEAVVAVVDEETGDEISPAVEAVSAKDAVYAQITHKVPVMVF